MRTRAIVGRNVQNCHPPQSVDRVEKILDTFKDGSRDQAEFWLNLKGKMIYIVFYAVRDENGKYLGTLEVAQDITRLHNTGGRFFCVVFIDIIHLLTNRQNRKYTKEPSPCVVIIFGWRWGRGSGRYAAGT